MAQWGVDAVWFSAGAVSVFVVAVLAHFLLPRRLRPLPAAEASAFADLTVTVCLVCGDELPAGEEQCPSCSLDLRELVLEHRAARLGKAS